MNSRETYSACDLNNLYSILIRKKTPRLAKESISGIGEK